MESKTVILAVVRSAAGSPPPFELTANTCELWAKFLLNLQLLLAVGSRNLPESIYYSFDTIRMGYASPSA